MGGLDWLFYPALVILGLIFGSFLNVCIYRIPRNESIVWPGSHCPHCNHPLSVLDNLPLVSFLLLRGTCRYCHFPISRRYPLIEWLTPFLMVLVGWQSGFSWALLQGLILVCSLTAISFIDLDHQIIPDEITYPGLVIGFVLSWVSGNPGWKASLIGLLVGGGFLYLLALGYEWLTRKEGLGGGDIKLLAMIGAFQGWSGVLVSVLVGSLTGTIVGLLLIVIWKKSRTYAIPFGPFLSLGSLIHLFFGETLLTWYLG